MKGGDVGGLATVGEEPGRSPVAFQAIDSPLTLVQAKFASFTAEVCNELGCCQGSSQCLHASIHLALFAGTQCTVFCSFFLFCFVFAN